MTKIKLNRPIEKPTENVILPGNTYLFEIERFDDGLTRKKDKQLLRGYFRVIDEGEYFGVKLRHSYSIEDDVGNRKFAELWKAVMGSGSLETPFDEIDTDQLVGKKIYITVEVKEDTRVGEDGVERKFSYNDILNRNGYSPYEGGRPATQAQQTASTPPPKQEESNQVQAAAAAKTDDWD
ncbi:MAG: hypothetical protein AMS21_01085 [Gemmatimonas sp. SG8_38_2]|nr:MAG: hypothetical protein AMS21_01085 [Gemmatimonas sp. SG8_38_2]